VHHWHWNGYWSLSICSKVRARENPEKHQSAYRSLSIDDANFSRCSVEEAKVVANVLLLLCRFLLLSSVENELRRKTVTDVFIVYRRIIDHFTDFYTRPSLSSCV